MNTMTKVAFLQDICSKNVNPNDAILKYFDQIMWIYDYFDYGCEVIVVTTDEDSITCIIKYPYEFKASPVCRLLDLSNSQIIKIYNKFYLVNYQLKDPCIISLSLKHVNAPVGF